jgi:hypothetical protein
MANEFEKHIAMDPDKVDQPKGLYSEAKERVGNAAGEAGSVVRENIGTVSTTAILIGAAGFFIGWLCGQSSARSGRYWH